MLCWLGAFFNMKSLDFLCAVCATFLMGLLGATLVCSTNCSLYIAVIGLPLADFGSHFAQKPTDICRQRFYFSAALPVRSHCVDFSYWLLQMSGSCVFVCARVYLLLSAAPNKFVVHAWFIYKWHRTLNWIWTTRDRTATTTFICKSVVRPVTFEPSKCTRIRINQSQLRAITFQLWRKAPSNAKMAKGMEGEAQRKRRNKENAKKKSNEFMDFQGKTIEISFYIAPRLIVNVFVTWTCANCVVFFLHSARQSNSKIKQMASANMRTGEAIIFLISQCFRLCAHGKVKTRVNNRTKTLWWREWTA